MLSPRWHKVLRDLSSNKTRTLLVVLSISAGVFAVGVIANSQAMLTHDVAERYAEIHPYSAALTTTEPFDAGLVDAVRRMGELEDADGRYTALARIRKVDSGEWFQLSLNAFGDYDDIRINQIQPEAGAFPPQDREILIERSSLAFMKAKVGDRVEIEMASGRKRELRIAGVVRDLTIVPPTYSAPSVGYINLDTLEWLGEPRGLNRLLIAVAEKNRDKSHIEQVAARVRDDKVETEKRKVAVIDVSPYPGDPPLSFVTQAMLMILGALSGMVLLPSGFLVINTISALLTQEVRQVGIMKAVGARTRQIIGMYLIVVVLFGLLALVIPLPLAAIGARVFSSYMAEILNLDLATFSFPPETILLQVVVALLVPILAAFYPIIVGTRVTVREAITSYGLVNREFGASWIDRLVERVRGLPRPLLLSLRNAVRRKGRLGLTLVPLTLGGALFIAVLSVHASLLLSLDELSQFWKYDMAIDLHRAYTRERIEQEVLAVPGIVGVELWNTASAVRVRADGSESMGLPFIALPASTPLVQPAIVEGRWLLPEDENAIVVSTTLLRYEPGIRVGDEIVLKIGGRKTPWRVVGFAKGGMTLIPNVYANFPYFARLMGEPDRANSLRVMTAEHTTAFQVLTMKAVEEHFKQVGLRVSMTESSAELVERIRGGMLALVVFLLVLAILLAAVGGLGLVGTVSLNVLERTREIGVMRAIGASNGAIIQIVMAESILVGVISWIGSAVLAYPISQVLSTQTGDLLFKTPLSFAFAPSGILLWLACVVALSAIASIVPARNATRLTVREVLTYE